MILLTGNYIHFKGEKQALFGRGELEKGDRFFIN